MIITLPCRSCGMDMRTFSDQTEPPICDGCCVAERYEKRIEHREGQIEAILAELVDDPTPYEWTSHTDLGDVARDFAGVVAARAKRAEGDLLEAQHVIELLRRRCPVDVMAAERTAAAQRASAIEAASQRKEGQDA